MSKKGGTLGDSYHFTFLPYELENFTMNPITKAESEINRILQKLEDETGSIVEGVEIIDIDTTELHSQLQELQRRVRIDIARLPGTNWPA